METRVKNLGGGTTEDIQRAAAYRDFEPKPERCKPSTVAALRLEIAELRERLNKLERSVRPIVIRNTPLGGSR